MKFKIIVLSCILILSFGCSQTTEPEIPGWVNNLISDFKAQPVGNPPQSIWQYEYKEQFVYFVLLNAVINLALFMIVMEILFVHLMAE